MNLTVDQMDVLNFRLTEVSLELLGNKFYDIFGQKCDTLGSLYRSKKGRTKNKFATDADLVKALKVQDIFNSNDEPPEDSRIANDNTEQIVDDVYDSDDDNDDSDDREQKSINELKINKMISDVEAEYTRLKMCSESAKMKYFITNKHRIETEYEDEYEICNRYHIQENAQLMAQSDAFIKLIKYIKCDARNESKMGVMAANILKVKDFISNASSTSK